MHIYIYLIICFHNLQLTSSFQLDVLSNFPSLYLCGNFEIKMEVVAIGTFLGKIFCDTMGNAWCPLGSFPMLTIMSEQLNHYRKSINGNSRGQSEHYCLLDQMSDTNKLHSYQLEKQIENYMFSMIYKVVVQILKSGFYSFEQQVTFSQDQQTIPTYRTFDTKEIYLFFTT